MLIRDAVDAHEIGQMLVRSGLGLLGMTKERVGLEKIFMQLVRGNERGRS